MHGVAVPGTRVSSLIVGGFPMVLLLPTVEDRDSTCFEISKSSVGQAGGDGGTAESGRCSGCTVNSRLAPEQSCSSTLPPPTSVISTRNPSSVSS